MTNEELGARVAQLEDLESIKRVKARYFRLVDAHDFAGLSQLFWEDAVINSSTASGSRDEFLQALKKRVGARMFHAGHSGEVEFTDSTTAVGHWAMSFTMRSETDDGIVITTGFRRYEDSYAKRDGEWRIARMAMDDVGLDSTYLEPRIF
ncbi:nuclear transport factor 2 family protein [Rhodococcus sp. NPDC059968]|uniref:nuclear transport factor 2 family protein n=1 Tax=Rhodococcus sp. NPDC059968 TaxID=3347017 RepID=UPI0036721931